MPKPVRRTLLLVLLLAASGAGCSKDNTARISGTVTLDGTPLEKGTISLSPADGRSPTAEAIITAGKYSVTTLPGPKNVIIHGLKKVGERRYHPEDPTSPLVDVNEETVPERYNTASELHEQLQAGAQTLDFALQSKSP